MNFVLLGFILLVLFLLIREVIANEKRNNLIERLNYGLESDTEDDAPSLWDGASDVLKVAKIRAALYQSPLLSKFDLMLRRANIKISLLTAILIFIAASAISAVSAYLYWGSFRSLVASLLVLPTLLWSGLSILSSNRQKKLDTQLPALISNFLTTLNAGGTPVQALQSAAKNAPDPMASAMGLIMENISLGKSPQVVWQDWADFWDTKSTKLVATGIKIKWETGGQMTAILQHISETLEFNKRMELRVSTLTAQAKLSSYVLSALPVGLFFLTKSYRPDLFDVMFTDPLGRDLLWASVILTVGGFLWLRKLAKLKY